MKPRCPTIASASGGLVCLVRRKARSGSKQNLPSKKMDRSTTTARLILFIVPLALAGTPARAAQVDSTAGPQEPPASFYSKNTPKDLVEFELMTWPEVYRAIH